jgi:archaellum component FlaG (FlaF/FlaG flagellin family)
MVIRELMHLDMVQSGTSGTGHSSLVNGMNYGGVVTIASPLQGAAIINNRSQIPQMANDACNRLAFGFECEWNYLGNNMINSLPDKIRFIGIPIITLENVKSSLKEFISNTLGAIAEGGCNIISNTALPMFFNTMYAGTTNDYKVGASMVTTLNQDANNTQYKSFPKMAFYAIEPQDNIFWRTLTWLVNNPNGGNPNGPNVGYFDANDDWYLYDNTIKGMINHYQIKALTYKCLSDVHLYAVNCVRKKDKPAQIEAYAKAILTHFAYTSGSEWFNNANESWQVIIGAKERNGNTVTFKSENDGIVLSESAANLPNPTHESVCIFYNEHFLTASSKGSSHMQVRNDEGLKKHLKKLFDGDYDDWFSVNEEK